MINEFSGGAKDKHDTNYFLGGNDNSSFLNHKRSEFEVNGTYFVSKSEETVNFGLIDNLKKENNEANPSKKHEILKYDQDFSLKEIKLIFDEPIQKDKNSENELYIPPIKNFHNKVTNEVNETDIEKIFNPFEAYFKVDTIDFNDPKYDIIEPYKPNNKVFVSQLDVELSVIKNPNKKDNRDYFDPKLKKKEILSAI